MANPNFLHNYAGNDFRAVAIEQKIRNQWRYQLFRQLGLLALIDDNETKFKHENLKQGKDGVIVGVLYDNVDALNESTIGVHPGNMTPTAWPVYDNREGMTQARFPWTYLQDSMDIKMIDRRILQYGDRGNTVAGKMEATKQKWKRTINAMVSGNLAASSTNLQGLQHMLATGNTVGGISQATNPWWRANVVTNTGTLTATMVENDLDLMQQVADSEGATDCILADFVPGGFNVFGKIKSFVPPTEQVMFKDFYAKYGVEHMWYRGRKLFMDPQGAGGTIKYLASRDFFWAGEKEPTTLPEVRIYASGSYDVTIVQVCAFGCMRLNNQLYRTGITA